jgi:regulator of sigma E protease
MPVVQSAITIVLFILILGGLVVIHELGHFIVARLAHIRVHEFGIGFPPRARTIGSDGETLYTLNWLPIGGFVRLEGEDGDSDDPRSFTSARLPVKLVVLVAGVFMNLVLAFLIFFFIAWLATPIVGLQFTGVQPGSPAASAGLVVGDTIVSVDGTRYEAFNTDPSVGPVADLRSRAGSEVTLGVRHADGTVTDLTTTLRTPEEINASQGALGIEGLSYHYDYIQQDVVTALQVAARQTVVGIAVQVGDVFWQLGPIFTLYLAGLLSANLALVNVLPFPPLDGGRMLVTVIKSMAGSRLSVRAEQLTYLVGFVALFGLIAWVTFFDVVRQLTGGSTP